MHYLRHLARLRTTDIHPGGAKATHTLLQGLLLRDGLDVLELGCGTGGTAVRVAVSVGAHVVGLDLLAEMLLAARERAAAHPIRGRCTFVQGDVTALPFRGESFDRVYSESVLGIQTRTGIPRALAETCRVLKPGGLFVANEAVWRPGIDQATVTAVNRKCDIDFGLRPASEHAWSVEDWLLELAGAGLEPLSWRRLAPRDPHEVSWWNFDRWKRRLRLARSPSLLRAQLRYRRRIASHRTDAPLIEARLFIAAKMA